MSAGSSTEPFVPLRLLTVAEYLALGETERGYDELVEGRVVTSPAPGPGHSHAQLGVALQVDPQLPPHLDVLHNIDIDLELAPPDAPGFTRRPDLVIFTREAPHRVRYRGDCIKASEVAVVMEFVSPGSQRTDNVIKRTDYADAGIPHYWIIDLAEPVTLTACHLAGEFGYADGGEITGMFRATVPFPVELDLDALI